MPWTRQGIPVRINNADATLNVSDVPLIKTVTLTKTSADVSITNGNSNYSLAGAVYNVYVANGDPNHDYSKDTVVATFTTGANGKAVLSRTLKPNTRYAIKERTAPKGYVLDKEVHTFFLTYDSNTMDVVDDPTKIRLTVRKKTRKQTQVPHKVTLLWKERSTKFRIQTVERRLKKS